ncbi:GtrA family protein [Paraburkholderia graminis]|uniref:GtrA family protein n=1 Tax=Paraburkholderia graminis TaxID=60548 RepID=UPI0038B6CAD3
MMNAQFIRFAVAGVVGFAADAGVLYLALACGLGPFFGRVISFLAAVWVTWQINRRYTFRERAERSAWVEWWRYLLSMLTGASVNYAAYTLVILSGPRSSWLPLVGVACGSVAGMFVNFFAAKLWAFRK